MAPTGSTFTPRSARLFTAFAPPPGSTVRSRCFRMSTGASRDTREISPYTNSSATRSPSTVIVTLGKASTIFCSRSTSFKCLVIGNSRRRPVVAVTGIFSRVGSAVLDRAQHGIHSVSCVGKLHLYRNHGQRREGPEISTEIYCIFFGSHETASFTSPIKFKQVANIFFSVSVMIAEECLRYRIDSRCAELQHKILRPRNSAKHERPCRDILHRDSPPQFPNHLPFNRKRFRRSCAGQHDRIGPPQSAQRLSQPPRGKQPIARIIGRHQHNIEIAG